ncbi:G-protein coupled receptor GRL101-like [Littorina saxatilis]|uniref:G-protein coupled receptor GRL101-like n=1 Tax=Littorina saxatilis TaxID=31220 RepID=UPI0038B4C6BB
MGPSVDGLEQKPRPEEQLPKSVQLPVPANMSWSVPVFRCPAQHVVHSFLACDARSQCWAEQESSREGWDGPSVTSCSASMTSFPPSLGCSSGEGDTPYTLVCDHRPDCPDGSDEDFCVFPPCGGQTPLPCKGKSKQCYGKDGRCDGKEDCVGSSSDELNCYHYQAGTVQRFKNFDPPAIIDFIGKGSYTITRIDHFTGCPETHFQCPGGGFCLPVFTICNGVYDCPDHEDELGCDGYQCQGFYRCRGSKVCLHSKHLCDGMHQCPRHDDELLCDLLCPTGCTCHGLAFTCRDHFLAEQHPDLRYLDASDSFMTLDKFAHNEMLIHLSVARGGLKNISGLMLPNLRSLDVSENELTFVSEDHFNQTLNLKILILVGNPLTSFASSAGHVPIPQVEILDLSYVQMPSLNATGLLFHDSLRTLNLTECGVKTIATDGFQSLPNLESLDLRGCPISVTPYGLFRGLNKLRQVWSDNYRLCCPDTLPTGVAEIHCQSPEDLVSSCDDLLGSVFRRVFTNMHSLLSVLGNLALIISRRRTAKREDKATSMEMMVDHLMCSGTVMGVYLAIISLADIVHRGSYGLEDRAWRDGAMCEAAGFLLLLSSLVSVVVMFLITVDRVIAVCPRFSRQGFSNTCCLILLAVTWIAALALSSVPLAPHAQLDTPLHSQTALCNPFLALSSEDATVLFFHFLIAFTIILVSLTAAGQAYVLFLIRSNARALFIGSNKATALVASQRALNITFFHVITWVVVPWVWVLDAAHGVPVPDEVRVVVAVAVQPVSSVLLPVMHVLSLRLEDSRQQQRARVLKRLGLKNTTTTGASSHRTSLPDRPSRVEDK